MSLDPKQVFTEARRLLELSGSPSPERDASALMDAAAGENLRPWDPIPDEVADRFQHMVERRVRGEPVSQIIGRRAFWMHDFAVTRDVLDPRPDTEALVEAALQVPFERVLDLGTGSGCILLSLLAERAGAAGTGVDISRAALDVAKENAKSLGVESRTTLIESHWFDAVSGGFDLIVSNPPYIDADAYAGLDRTVREFEPEIALTPGQTGLEAYEIIVPGARAHLEPGGWLMVEIGFDQGTAVKSLFEQADFREVTVLPDLDGRDRVVQGQNPPISAD